MKPGLLRGTLGVLSLISISQAWAASPDAPVTQEQFKAWTDWAKKSVEVLDQRQKKVESQTAKSSTTTPTGGEQAVDLNAPSLSSSSTSGSSQANLGDLGEGAGHKGTKMETYFDLNLINQPGSTNSLAFDSYHNLVFFDITPRPDLTFSFNLLGPQIFPLYYELDYQATKALTLRAGKIWIAFDDISPMDPHSIFGGRESVKQLMPANSGNAVNQYLPSIWTELGVAAKLVLVDSEALQLETHLSVTNGFTDGGVDPVNPSSLDYPNFAQYTPLGTSNGGVQSGNHRNKAISTRAHALFGNTFGLGFSYYTGQWNQDSDPAGHLGLYIIGADAQLKLLGLEFRGGVSSMGVQLPASNFARRGGTYAEVGMPIGQKWKAMLRGGTLNLDNRIAEATDMTVIGGSILYNPGAVQFSLESNRDVKNPGVGVNFVSYTDLRMIMLF